MREAKENLKEKQNHPMPQVFQGLPEVILQLLLQTAANSAAGRSKFCCSLFLVSAAALIIPSLPLGAGRSAANVDPGPRGIVLD